MAIFEAPVAHEAAHYSNPYSNPEFEEEWEVHEGSHYSNPEASHYSNPYSNPYSTPEFEEEWETHEGSHYSNPYSNPELEFEDEAEFLGNILRGIGGLFGGEEGEVGHEMEYEFEDEASHYSNPEMEDEADRFFFGKLRGLIGRIRRRVRGLARRALSIVPGVTRAISGIVSESHPMADRMLNAMAQEAEMEVAHMENHFTNTFAQTGETEHPEVHEALMSELMAANASATQSEAEAEAILAATIPLTIRFMRSQRTLLPVTPGLVQANVRLVRTLRSQGRDGHQLLRLLPTIHRNTVAILRHVALRQRLTTPLAVRAMAVATRRVMRNPRRTERALQRNIALQVRASRTNRPRGSLPLRPLPRRQRTAV